MFADHRRNVIGNGKEIKLIYFMKRNWFIHNLQIECSKTNFLYKLKHYFLLVTKIAARRLVRYLNKSFQIPPQIEAPMILMTSEQNEYFSLWWLFLRKSAGISDVDMCSSLTAPSLTAVRMKWFFRLMYFVLSVMTGFSLTLIAVSEYVKIHTASFTSSVSVIICNTVI